VTPYDNKLDRESINPRKQAFEKMVSGMYIGEVVRNVLLSLIDHGLLFSGYSSSVLNTHYGLDTALMSSIEQHPSSAYSTTPTNSSSEAEDWETSIRETRKVLTTTLGLQDKHITDADCLVVRRVCEVVGTRGARLSAVAIAAVIKQVRWSPSSAGKDEVAGEEFNVGVDGSLCEFYPGFEARIRHALKSMVGEASEKKVIIGLAKDGSGIGGELSIVLLNGSALKL